MCCFSYQAFDLYVFVIVSDIQIVSVKPVSRERSEFIGREVPTEIAAFYQTNEVDTFMFDRPYHRGVMDKNNEFKVSGQSRGIFVHDEVVE